MTVRILLVDDHELMREGLRSILENERGLEVVGESGSGREAVKLAAELRPDVVVMDVSMQDMNGIEATRQIKAENPGIRVVALSSYSDRRYVTAILKAGALAYVLKANAFAQLRQAVQSAAAGRSFLSDEVADCVVDEIRTKGSRSGSAYALLSAREREVLQLLAEGHSSRTIATRLHVSPSTIETHRRNLMRRLDLHSVANLTKYAIREGLTSLDD